MPRPESRIAPYLDQIRALNFVRDLRYTARERRKDSRADGVLRLRTPKGTFEFLVERKTSYLDRALLNALVAHTRYENTSRLLLFARYIPRPSADRLIKSRINFVDRAGNMHLVLGQNYERTIVGNKEARSQKEEKSLTPGKVQLLFTLAAQEDAKNQTVRQLAESSGLSKSNVAQLRQQLVHEGTLRCMEDSYEFLHPSEIEELLVRGYEEVLRPRLLFKRFRSAESSAEKTLDTMKPILAKRSIQWSLTGGLASYELQGFYKGTGLVLFLDYFSDELMRHLRLLPDVNGPITFLRSFGEVTSWRVLRGNKVAHPWLIYSELMHSSDPRAHEAATELKGEFLKSWSS